mgnify:CR=1 FL=1
MDVFATARAAGIHTEYLDANGNHRPADVSVLQAVLVALSQQISAENHTPIAHEGKVAFQGDFGRLWLLTCQLYSLRSDRNWGIGDFSDLRDLIALSRRWGCAGVGLNPLHILFDDRPTECSPYAPNSRLFLNTLYIDWSNVPELPKGWIDARADELARAKQSELVDYETVALLKRAAAREAFRMFNAEPDAHRRESFATFCRRRGRSLRYFSCFEVLRKQFSSVWWDWPEQWQRPSGNLIYTLRSGEYADEIHFVEFTQWIADQQLSECADAARRSGMKIGLYLDVAVGVQAGGFDSWYEQAAISRSLSVGAPPDALNTAGQDWGLSGFSGPGLRLRSFEPLRDILENGMRYSGAIRLDHVMGLRRIFLIPHGVSARDGVYIDMPFEEMAGVIAEASHQFRCIVIGEDLGTVPDGLRDQLKSRGILSYTVMMFERNDGGFIAPADFRSNSLVTFNTHDLATFKGWHTGWDIATKQKLGIDPGESADDRRAAKDALRRRVGLDGSMEVDFLTVMAELAKSPSRLLAIGIEDLLGIEEQPNIPGTIGEHPNWRRKLPVGIELFAERIDIQRLTSAMTGRS